MERWSRSQPGGVGRRRELELTAGDKIPADCVYLEGSKLKTNEAAMTGEPIDIKEFGERSVFVVRDERLGREREVRRRRVGGHFS